ncbi:polyphenol oxidase family protein [Kalamiella sp. sgz302252]|uniref:polyphenol oxidase family protein n=1 Tax=Pantoea sp. sgz302252 TaxID=3341827 RepID=UPI0036D3328C
MSLTYRSALLSSFDWLEHAFQPAGEPPPPESVMNRQRHTASVLLDSEALPIKSQEADGLIGTGSRPVAIYTADCLPVLIADDRQKQVAAVHAGLNGALKGVLINAIRLLCERGATPQSLYIAIGPAIGPCCYELGKDRIEAMRQDDPHSLSSLLAWSPQQSSNQQALRAQAIGTTQGVWFDLPLLAKRMAMREGVPEAQIELSQICTYCMAEEQASYRRNGHFQHGYQQRYSWIGLSRSASAVLPSAE